MKLLTRNPLSYPSRGTPGFDQGHAAGQGVTFSALPFGNTFINLLNGKPGTITGDESVRPERQLRYDD
jgi:hypothetical protein